MVVVLVVVVVAAAVVAAAVAAAGSAMVAETELLVATEGAAVAGPVTAEPGTQATQLTDLAMKGVPVAKVGGMDLVVVAVPAAAKGAEEKAWVVAAACSACGYALAALVASALAQTDHQTGPWLCSARRVLGRPILELQSLRRPGSLLRPGYSSRGQGVGFQSCHRKSVGAAFRTKSIR